ncbi:HNH endonuclease [Paenibacillus sp. 19GGS1-52]|uniref:HNH endonuclease n=1 Tax=Paenibacillus sp. 19GGS1-52 TaxID=2758563 RepID=UPI001EFB0A4D|nr:HNH endonuclease [Paenibacillus sp. 19GGS1-52]ULO06278.1 HNH endonuclease [Paenibacillus sp. 19GGS1-52]
MTPSLVVVPDNTGISKLPEFVNNYEGVPIPVIPDSKMEASWKLLGNTVHLFDQVYVTQYKNYSFLYDRNQSPMTRFNNNKFDLYIKGKTLYLSNKRHPELLRKVYMDGEFIITKNNWLMQSGQRAGTGRYKCFTIYKNIIIRDHQLIALLTYGEIALLAIGDNRVYEVNHIDGDHENNASNNLEVVTIEANRKHRDRYITKINLLVCRKGEVIINPVLSKYSEILA